jgi:hypothetical protein
MIDRPWTQISAAIAGRHVGEFSGFVANVFPASSPVAPGGTSSDRRASTL